MCKTATSENNRTVFGRREKLHMKSAVHKHSIFINRRKTSVSLEDVFWLGLLEIAVYKKTTAPALVARIDGSRKTVNLSSAIRMFVFKYFKAGRKQNSSHRKKR